jgi:tetratricopeptide (TPR) repeat protein
MDLSTSEAVVEPSLRGQRVALVGRLAGMSKREAQQLVRGQGGTIVDKPDALATLIVVGERELPLGDSPEESFSDDVRAAVEQGTLEIIGESQLWQRLGLVDREKHIHNLYTPAMLAQLLGVDVLTIRRWQRRGWIVPAREVRRLPYFDFQEVATARRLTELLASGMTAAAIEKKLAALARYVPDIKRPLAQLSVIVEGRDLLLRQGEGLVEPGGQLRFDFGTSGAEETTPSASSLLFTSDVLSIAGHEASGPPLTPSAMLRMAGELEDQGELPGAAEMYRAALAAGGPGAETNFLLAELLYQMHDLTAARERYYMAIELDEDYVEARANLGCVLSELGEKELAISAFQGALEFHDAYPDVHYHLARVLDEVGRSGEADAHWEAFLKLAPTSPWADEARERLDRS